MPATFLTFEIKRNGLRKDPAQKRSSYRPRAPRFQIQTAVRYRESGQRTWSEGMTVNMSRSGVLFHAASELKPKTVLEMRILFPYEDPPANVVCWGPVVRTESPDPPDTRPLLAATISRYRFVRD